jgi:hypothetical protein
MQEPCRALGQALLPESQEPDPPYLSIDRNQIKRPYSPLSSTKLKAFPLNRDSSKAKSEIACKMCANTLALPEKIAIMWEVMA